MPSMTAAGTGLAISAGVPATQDAAGYGALSYTEISNVESLGGFGPTTEVTTFQPLRGAQQKHKGPTNFGALNPTIALEEADAGQALLTTASAPTNSALYAIRVSKPDGSLRYFQARVFGMPETIGAANSMITAAPVIEINTPVVKVAAGAPAAPVFSVQPSISPISGSVGTTFTASDGAASNTTSYARRWLLGSTAIGTGTTVTPTGAGSLSLEVTATGPGGTKVATSSAVTVAASAPTPSPTPAPPPTNLTNYTTAGAANFKTAMANITDDVIIFDTGPSTVAGQSTVGSKQPSFTDARKQWIGAVAPRAAALLQAEGINAGGANQWNGHHAGWGLGDTGANYLTGDDRITLGNTGTAFNGTNLGGGGLLLSATTDFGALALPEPATTADIWYRDPSGAAGRSFKWSVDGGTPTEVTLTGDNTFKKLTIPLGSRGLHTVKVEGTGKGGMVVNWINGYDATSGRKELQFVNNGVSGATSVALINDTDTVAGRLKLLTALAPKLVIVRDFHLNDQNQALSMSTAMTNTDTYIKAAKAAGASVLGFTPLWVSNTAQGDNANQDAWAAACKQVYLDNSVPFIDLRAELTSYAAADAQGFYSDQVHPTQIGYALIARRIADYVKYVRAS